MKNCLVTKGRVQVDETGNLTPCFLKYNKSSLLLISIGRTSRHIPFCSLIICSNISTALATILGQNSVNRLLSRAYFTPSSVLISHFSKSLHIYEPHSHANRFIILSFTSLATNLLWASDLSYAANLSFTHSASQTCSQL